MHLRSGKYLSTDDLRKNTPFGFLWLADETSLPYSVFPQWCWRWSSAGGVFSASVPLSEPESLSLATFPLFSPILWKAFGRLPWQYLTSIRARQNEAANEAAHTEGAHRRGHSKPSLFVLLCLLHFDPSLDWRGSLLSWKRSSSFHQRDQAQVIALYLGLAPSVPPFIWPATLSSFFILFSIVKINKLRKATALCWAQACLTCLLAVTIKITE